MVVADLNYLDFVPTIWACDGVATFGGDFFSAPCALELVHLHPFGNDKSPTKVGLDLISERLTLGRSVTKGSSHYPLAELGAMTRLTSPLLRFGLTYNS